MPGVPRSPAPATQTLGTRCVYMEVSLPSISLGLTCDEFSGHLFSPRWCLPSKFKGSLFSKSALYPSFRLYGMRGLDRQIYGVWRMRQNWWVCRLCLKVGKRLNGFFSDFLRINSNEKMWEYFNLWNACWH